MKKKSEKKLSLGRIKIASLSKPDQQVVKGGAYSNISNNTCGPRTCKLQ
jgi:hypothetical protein